MFLTDTVSRRGRASADSRPSAGETAILSADDGDDFSRRSDGARHGLLAAGLRGKIAWLCTLDGCAGLSRLFFGDDGGTARNDVFTENGRSHSVDAGLLCCYCDAFPYRFLCTESRPGGHRLYSSGTHWILPLADHPGSCGGSLPAGGGDNVCFAGCPGKLRRHFHAVAGGGAGRPLGTALGSFRCDLLSSPDDFDSAMDAPVTGAKRVDRTGRVGIDAALSKGERGRAGRVLKQMFYLTVSNICLN